ncbi:MAG: hypothetical protein R2827_16505 [Bdellovibrionales bacterium]
MSRFKVGILVIVSMLAVVGLFYFQVNQSFNSVFVKLQQDNTRRASQLLLQAAQQELSTLKTRTIALSKIEASRKWLEAPQSKAILSGDLKSSNFMGLAFLQSDSQRTHSLKWISLQPEIIENWSEYLISKIYQTIDYSRVPVGSVHFEKIQNHQKRPVWIVAFHVNFNDQNSIELEKPKKGVLVAMLSNNFLAKMGLAFRGFEYEFLLMNDDGFALSHSTTGYISASFKDYSMFDKHPFSKKEFFETSFNQAADQFWGVHQMVPNSNLRLAVSQNIRNFDVVPIVFDTKWLIGLFGLVLLALSILFFLRNEIEEKFLLLKTAVVNFSDGVTDVPPEWRKKLPNSIMALEKIMRNEKTESEIQVEKIKAAGQNASLESDGEEKEITASEQLLKKSRRVETESNWRPNRVQKIVAVRTQLGRQF